jgi:superfamily II DNA or RNA helicase
LFDNEEEQIEINSFLTYDDMSKVYTRGGFDARKIKKVHFLKKLKQYYICNSGFLYEVVKYAKENNLKITQIEDIRTKFPHNTKEYSYEELRSYFDPNFKYVEHQIRIVKAALKTNLMTIKSPTSSGKTETFIALIKLINLPSLIIFNSITLAVQTKQRMEEAGLECGIATGKGVVVKEHMVATIGSVLKIPDLHKYKILIVDEAHRSAAAQYQDFLSKTSYPIRFGFSATPEGNNKLNFARVRQFFGPILLEVGTKELIENEVLVKPKITFIKVECPKTLDWPSANEQCIMYNQERNNKIVEINNKYNLPTLILIKNIEHGQLLNRMIENSVFLSGIDDSSVREDALKDFRAGKIKTLIASSIFNEGISINEIRVLIIASGGKSKIQTTQRIGRSLRKDKGKDTAIVIDFADVGNKFTQKHSLMRYNTYKKLGFEVEK